MTEAIVIIIGIIGMIKNKENINLKYFLYNIILAIGVTKFIFEIFVKFVDKM